MVRAIGLQNMHVLQPTNVEILGANSSSCPILPGNQVRRRMAELMIPYKSHNRLLWLLSLININVLQQINVETLINTSANHPTKHSPPTETRAVQFAIGKINQWHEHQNNYS